MELTDANLQVSVSLLALAAVGVCMLLQPNPAGLATHERTGLPRCGFLAHTGLPCPTCGATTSASLFVRGRPVRAWRTHPMGAFLACLLILLIPAGFLSAAARCRWLPWLRRITLPIWTALFCVFLALCLVGWRGRVESYLNGKNGTGRPARNFIERHFPRSSLAVRKGSPIMTVGAPSAPISPSQRHPSS